MKAKRVRRWLRQFKRNRRMRLYTLSTAGLVIVLLATIITSIMSKTHIDPVAYQPLLNTIARGESNGNYNAYFGKGGNTSVRFTEMTLKQVMQWQEQYVSAGSVSSAVGKYQIVRPTLAGLVDELDLKGDELFDKPMQDKLAITLIERRGAIDYASQKLSREQFAANLAKEWAALPKVIGDKPHESYYAADGINKARISVDEVLRALNNLNS